MNNCFGLVSLYVELWFPTYRRQYGGGHHGHCLVSRLFEKQELTRKLLGQLTANEVPIVTGVPNEIFLCRLAKSNVEKQPHPLFELKGNFPNSNSIIISNHVSSLVTAGWQPDAVGLAYHGINLVTM
jgi:hypothetical protein